MTGFCITTADFAGRGYVHNEGGGLRMDLEMDVLDRLRNAHVHLHSCFLRELLIWHLFGI